MVNATKPWELKDEDPTKREIMAQLLLILATTADLITPFIPQTAEALQACIERSGDTITAVHKPSKPLFLRF
jgi:methionyl-tRNA synthetase